MVKPHPVTHMLGLVGDGITKSKTPPMHEMEGHAQGMSVVYRPIDLMKLGLDGEKDLPDILAWAKRLGYSGLNITQPCKQLVMPLLDELSPRAEELGAVNTVTIGADGKLTGYNTDWCGFQRGLEQALPGGAKDKNVVLVGAGGAGAAVAYALLTLGAKKLTVVELDESKRQGLVERMREIFAPERVVEGTDLAAALSDASGVVNATPVGMTNHAPGSPVPKELLRPDMWVADCIYLPLETQLLKDAREIGCITIDGGGMAVGQAAEAFSIFTGVEPDEKRMKEHFCDLIATE
jgi:quinate/shikimate dehydrogenase (NAD+)